MIKNNPLGSNWVNNNILGMRVDSITYKQTIDRVIDWSLNSKSRYVCVANVHTVMEAYDNPSFQKMINKADIVTPDGMPLVWALRRMGYKNQERVYGPDLTLKIVRAAVVNGVSVGFYGGTTQILNKLESNLKRKNQGLKITFQYSPPFRSLTVEEDRDILQAINDSGTQILFVGLGCPKQEIWMANHKGKVNAVMLGVGAAFNLCAGIKLQAPKWMQKTGLEWLFRLFQEPSRLWKRYLYNNPRFIILLGKQLFFNFRE